MTEPLNSQALNSIVASLLTLGVGIYPYFQKRNKLTRLFALSNLTLAIWNLSDCIAINVPNHQIGLIVDRTFYIFGVLTVWYFFQYMVCFAGVPLEQYQRWWKAIRVVGVTLMLSAPTP